MNKTQAKILVVCENTPTNERFFENICSNMELSYSYFCLQMRTMIWKGWIKTAKSRSKKIVTTVSASALQQAKEELSNGTR